MLNSDDFSSSDLDPIWRFEGPAETSAELGVNTEDAFLKLVTPDGNFDAWQTNTTARLLQDADDVDFQLETRFLSTPSEQFQSQGFLVEADAQNWLRFDILSDGTNLRAFGAVTVNGVTSPRFNVVIPEGEAPFLRLTRTGDFWTFEYSQDSLVWTAAGSFSHAINVSSTGLFAGNSGLSDGYTAEIDYFENTAAPIIDEDGTFVPGNLAPDAQDDSLTTVKDTAVTIDIDEDLLSNDSDDNGDPIGITAFTQPTNGVLVDNLDGTLTYTPNVGFSGADTFTYTISDGEAEDTASVEITVLGQPLISDDFSAGALDPAWRFEGPSETTFSFGSDQGEAFLNIETPDGTFDAWQTNTAARILQATDDTDFQLEARFLSTPTGRYQNQGFLIEADELNWLRFDTYSDGSNLRAFGAVTVNGVTSARFNVTIQESQAPFLMLTRSGDVWTFEYSQDGVTWTTAGSFSHQIVVAEAGLFAGNSDASTGFTAQVDYFENTALPLETEDGTVIGDNAPPVAVDDALIAAIDEDLQIDIDVDLLANDVDANNDVLTLESFSAPSNGVLIDNNDGTLTYTPDPGFAGTDSFTYTVTDGEDISVATVEINVSAGPLTSDDFSGATLDPIWRFEGPGATGFDLTLGQSDAFLTLTTPDGNFDAWQNNNTARILQNVDDGDFQLETRFLTTPSVRFQTQGFLVEADEQNWMRFDTFSDGTNLHAFAAITINGASSPLFDVIIPEGQAPFLRLTRSDDTWTFDYSQDGVVWTTAGVTENQLPLTSVGLFSGNSDQAAGYTAEIDYFQNTAAPIVDDAGLIFSDDFTGDQLADIWTIEGPAEVTVETGVEGTDAFVSLGTPDGTFEAFNTNEAARIVQTTDDTDFQLETRFLSTPTERFQNQGFLVEEDENNWLRFDTMSDGTVLRAFAGVTVDGATSAQFSVIIPEGEAPYLRLTRSGDQWTFEHSQDGENWVIAGSFSHDIEVSAVGLLAGNSDASTGFVAKVDYFENTAAPIVNEDSLIFSDDFASNELSDIWRVEGPAEIEVTTEINSTDAFLAIHTPDGEFDAGQTNTAARVLQSAADEDFQLEARFLSTPSGRFQDQGFLIEQDADNWMRFDTYSDGSNLYAFAAATVEGQFFPGFNVLIPEGQAPYLRLTRNGDDWLFEYSQNGVSFTTAGTFSHNLEVTAVGLFAGNSDQSDGFTAKVDYFENTAAPIADEDGGLSLLNTPPVAADDLLAAPEDTQILIDIDADLLINDGDANGDPLTLASTSAPSNGVLVNNLDGTLTYTPDVGFNGVDSFTYTIEDGIDDDTATVEILVGNPIDVWYGLEQTFGELGEPQEWINILGNVGGEPVSLTYSLNGGEEQVLSIGSDTRRLQNEGDFNVEISYFDLDGSAVDDVVTIEAVLESGAVHTRDVIIDYEDGPTWTPNFSTDWNAATSISDYAQIADGVWTIEDGTIRPTELGYDRLVVLGDRTWDNYEINTTITLHDLSNLDPAGRDGGGFAIGFLWQGHSDTPIPNFQPRAGWEPGAAVFFNDHNLDGVGPLTIHPSQDFLNNIGQTNFAMEEGRTYNYTIRVEQSGLYDREYSVKVWEVGTDEPDDWVLQATQTFSLNDAPSTGSVYLNAHYNDVAFGDVTVTEITGRDIYQGSEIDEVAIAVDVNGNAGQGELDVFVGAGGSDTFVFGDENRAYYDDGVAADSGEDDYGFVWDFEVGVDEVQLSGDASDYTLVQNAAGLPDGTAIYLTGQNDDANELIGVLNGVTGIDLTDDNFVYVGSGLFA